MKASPLATAAILSLGLSGCVNSYVLRPVVANSANASRVIAEARTRPVRQGVILVCTSAGETKLLSGARLDHERLCDEAAQCTRLKDLAAIGDPRPHWVFGVLPVMHNEDKVCKDQIHE